VNRYILANAKLLILGFWVRALGGCHPALGPFDLIAEIHGIFRAHYNWWAGARPPGVDQTAHASPDVPIRELGSVRPPVWNLLVRGSGRLNWLLFLHLALPAGRVGVSARV
jgi:hypothetical protein